MANPTWSQEIDNLFTTTWAYRQTEAIQQAFLSNPFMYWLKEKGQAKEVRGHTRLEIPLDYGSNETVRWITKGSTVPYQEHDLVTMCYDDWKYVAVSITRFGTDDHKNRGTARIINYVEKKIATAERGLWENFEQTVNSDGTGTDEPNGIQNLMSITPSTGTVHNLNRATYDWWRPQYSAASGNSSLYLLGDMRTAMNDCVKYDRVGMKDLIMYSDQNSYEAYEDEVMEQKLIVNKTLGDAGFDHITYKTRPLIWSHAAQTNTMRFINTNYLHLFYDPDLWFNMTEWKAIPNQVNDKVAQIACTMQMMLTRPIACKTIGVTPG